MRCKSSPSHPRSVPTCVSTVICDAIPSPIILLPIGTAGVGFRIMTSRSLIVLLAGLVVSHSIANTADPDVRIVDTPDKGIQPKLVVDDAGTVHLVYYRGKDDGGDLFYTRKERNREFTKPVRINSIPARNTAAR